jgi:hypothetical protein
MNVVCVRNCQHVDFEELLIIILTHHFRNHQVPNTVAREKVFHLTHGVFFLTQQN